jgi:signal transduction histidine kinase
LLAHDARNILSGLMLYCELLASPGVLATPHSHYAKDLESIVRSAAEIVERMAVAQSSALSASSAASLPSIPVTDAAAELRHLQPLLAAIAGPSVRVSIATMPCAGALPLAVEDLTRILVNLVRNAADAMRPGGHIGITAQFAQRTGSVDSPSPLSCSTTRSVVLSIADDGPGIPLPMRSRIFEPGFTTHHQASDWPAPRRRGLGLSIVRDLVESAGGAVLLAPTTCGARFEISFPIDECITSDTPSTPLNSAFPADGRGRGCIECQ